MTAPLADKAMSTNRMRGQDEGWRNGLRTRLGNAGGTSKPRSQFGAARRWRQRMVRRTHQPKIEKLRAARFAAPDIDTQKKLATEIQAEALDAVPPVPPG